MAFIYDLTDTWNNAGISFNGIKLNATDTASAAGSKLLDLQISGASKFTVGKTGTVIATGLIESTVGGFKFPDGTTQTTKATVNSVSGTGTVNGITLTGTVTDSGSLTLGGTLGNIANNQLTNSAITINGTSTPLGGSIAVGTVTSVSGTGTVSGLSLTGSITTSGSLTLGGTLVLTSGQVTDALGFTPYDATNPTGYITASALTPYLTSATAATTYQPLDGDLTAIAALAGTAGLVRKTAANTYALDTAVYITGITSGDVTTALGFTPYNATNPAGYTTNVGTVTSVAALTLGTSGTDLASSVANSTTTPVITLNVPTASASNRGALSSSDWSTFNAKQAALVSGTNIKTVGGASLLGSGDVGTIGLAYGGTGATTESGARTALGLGTAAVLNAGVAGGVATLDGSGTVPTSQLPGAVLGGLNYQGTWNASTNTPTLASSTGSKGYYYVVSVAGSTNLNGITDWKIGDWAVYDGTAWQKVDNTDAVSSVNGFTGAVVLTTSDVAQGTNLYFTQAAARGSVSAGTGISYDSGTGVITNSAPDQTVALTGAGTTVVTGTYPNFTITSNDSTVGTVTSVGGTGTVSGLTLTGTVTTSGNLTLGGTLAVTPSNFASQTANTVLAAPNGAAGVPTFRAIVAADIPTLNQNTTGTASNVTGTVAVGNGGTGATTLSSGYVLKGNGTSAVSASVVYDNGTNVGIGTASPGQKLSVAGNTLLPITNSYFCYTNDYGIGTPDSLGLQVFASNGDVLRFGHRTGGTTFTEDMRIASNGNVGIGTSSPSGKLHINGNFLRIDQSGSNASFLGNAADLITGAPAGTGFRFDGTALRIAASSTEIAQFTSGGNVGIGTSSPVGRLDAVSASATGNIINARNTSSSQFFIGGVGLQNGATANNSGVTIGTGVRDADGTDSFFTINKTTSAGSYVAELAYYDLSADFWKFSTSNAERMRITSAGNVGIGTTAPGAKLEVAGGDLRVNGTGTGNIGITLKRTAGTTSDWYQYIPSGSDAFVWFQGGVGAERMRIDSSGNVGIGTTSPFDKLHVDGSTLLSWGADNKFWMAFSNDYRMGMRLSSDTRSATIFATGPAGDGGSIRFNTRAATASGATDYGLERMRIDASGNVGIGLTPSVKFQVAGTARVNQSGATRYRSDWYLESGGAFLNGYDDTAAVYLPVGFNFSTYTFSSGASERMRIDSSGNVGIGTTTPGGPLQVKTSGGQWRIETNGTGTKMVGVNAANNAEDIITMQGSPITFFSNGSERARIDSSGNVGIGTSSVTGSRVQIKGANNNVGAYADGLKVTSLNESVEAQYSWWGINANSSLQFATGGTERMRIDSSGNLLVNCTGTGSTVDGLRLTSSNVAQFSRSNGDCISANRNGSDGQVVVWYRGGTEVGSVSVTGSATAYNTSSDYRLKDIDGPIANSGAYIDALKPVQGSWKVDGSRFIGLLAHEVQEVSETPIATGEKDGEEMQAMDYSAPELIANLIAELQSLRARVAQLEGN